MNFSHFRCRKFISKVNMLMKLQTLFNHIVTNIWAHLSTTGLIYYFYFLKKKAHILSTRLCERKHNLRLKLHITKTEDREDTLLRLYLWISCITSGLSIGSSPLPPFLFAPAEMKIAIDHKPRHNNTPIPLSLK